MGSIVIDSSWREELLIWVPFEFNVWNFLSLGCCLYFPKIKPTAFHSHNTNTSQIISFSLPFLSCGGWQEPTSIPPSTSITCSKEMSLATSTTNSTKKPSSSPYSSFISSKSSNKTQLPSARTHSCMLVLTKPTPQPVT